MSNILSSYVGDRKFYQMVLSVALPMMLQNAISNFVSLLDNIMIGRIGTNPMTGVASANQLMFVFNLCCFGAVSGAGIFCAQYSGKGDHRGIADTMRFKLYTALFLSIAGIGIFLIYGSDFINLYLQGSGDPADALESLTCGVAYLQVMLFGLLPFTLIQAYASTLRETGETVVPMLAGIVAVLVNLCLNYVLIFGHCGIPAMGVVGAAIATVISRFTELLIVVFWTHTHRERNRFIQMVYRSARIPLSLTREIFVKGMPLMMNELLWSFGLAALTQSYSVLGLHVVAALNISSTITNLFNVVYLSLGSAVSIVVGQLLGAGEMEKAVETARRMIAFAVVGCLAVGMVLYCIAPLFPEIYNTTDDVRNLATSVIRVGALYMPIGSFLNACYFTLRSGGKTIITFFFDSVFVCCVSLPCARLLVHFTALPVLTIYILVTSLDLLKCLLGYILVKRRVWVNNIIKET